MAEGSQPLRFTVFGVADTSIRILRRNVFPILLLSLLVYLPVPMLGMWASPMWIGPKYHHEALVFLALLSMFTLGPFLDAAVTAWTVRHMHGRTTSHVHCLLSGARRYPSVMVTGFVVNLLAGATTPLLVVPALIVTTLVWVAIPVAAIERRSVFDCLDRSSKLTKGRRWRVLGLNLLSTVALAPAAALAGILAGSVLSVPFVLLFSLVPGVDMFGVYFSFVHWFIWAAASAVICVVSAVSYYTLVVEKEGRGTSTFAFRREPSG